MAYLGKTPSQAVRSRFYYTAAGSETSLSGADDNNNTLIFTDGNYVDVYLNGVLLVSDTDYNTNTTNTISGLAALATNDIVEIVVYDTFSVFGGEVKGDFNVTNGILTADFEGTFTFQAKNTSGGSISKGTPVYISGHSGNNAEIGVADANDPSKMPSFGIAAETIGNNLTGKIVSYGNLKEIDTSAFAVGNELYVSNTGTLTSTRPTGTSDSVQKVAKVIRSHASVGQLFVMGAGRTNDIPNSTSNNLLFEDNAKAIFGAGSDLQIGHDGAVSFITDSGTGDLYIQGSSAIRLTNPIGNEPFAVFNDNGAASLYYDGGVSLSTTATGVDITGTLTADGLTVDGASTFVNFTSSNNSAYVRLQNSVATGGYIGYQNDDLQLWANASYKGFMLDGATNDISFYDSTGTTQGFFWDASTQRLGLGTTSPDQTLVVKTADGGGIAIENAAGNQYRWAVNGDDSFSVVDSGTAERLRITAAGNVGIGTTAPLRDLHVSNGGAEGYEFGPGESANKNQTLHYNRSTSQYIENSNRASQHTWDVGSSEAMRIDSSGNVGIGTIPGSAKLFVEGGQTILRNNHTTTSLSGNTDKTSFPHALSVANDSGGSNTNLASIGFSIGTTGSVSNGAIVGHSTAAGSMDLAFYTESSNVIGERMRVTSGGNVGIATTDPQNELDVRGTVEIGNGSTQRMYLQGTGPDFRFYDRANLAERVRIDSSGSVMFQTTDHDGGVSTSSGQPQFSFRSVDGLRASTSGTHYFNKFNDGTIIIFRGQGTDEGNISISGTTISYNGGHLARWSQATDGNRIDGLVKGTVMTNLDQMAVWHHEAQPATYYEEGDELPEGISVGDEKTAAVAAYDEDNEQLNCMAVSSVEGDANVAGVFVNWDDDDTDFTADMNIAMTGDMVIRIAQGTTVARGDLLMSAGDGTAKPQGDDIVRSKTIAKVTSTNVSHTYDDGSYLVPCVLMAC